MAQAASKKPDPLLTLLGRYEAEVAAFNEELGPGTKDWDRIAEETFSSTLHEILEREPEATTAEGALLALDHVLNSALFEERAEFAEHQMLWLLIKAARDFIARLELGDC